MKRYAALLIFTPALVGCAGFEYNTLKVSSGGSRGNGAILGPDTLVTVKHVIEDPDDVKIWYWRDNRFRTFPAGSGRRNRGYWLDAKVIKELPTDGFEPLVVLKVQGYKKNPGLFDWGGFKSRDFNTPAEDVSPHKILTLRGSFLWGKECIVGGDSGSPILNKSGQLIGLVSATQEVESSKDCPVCWVSHQKEHTIYTRLPKSFSWK